MIELNVRNRIRTARGRSEAVQSEILLHPEETVFFVMDVWDRHWCADVNRKSPELAEQINKALMRVRDLGGRILHMPADCMKFYDDFPQRLAMKSEPRLVRSRQLFRGRSHNIFRDGGFFPVQMSRQGGCPCEPVCRNEPVWTKQHAAIKIYPEDLISDHPLEVYNFLQNHRIKNILYAGLHANVCLLKRPLGIRKLSGLGFNCMLCRDLTDIMYDLKSPPRVSHEEALRIVLEYIELRLCPTLESGEL